MRRRWMRRARHVKFFEERYLRVHGKRPDLTNPKKFTEKLLCKMIYLDRVNNPKIFTRLADKYSVRNYVQQKVGEEYLVKLLWHGKNPKSIPFNSLPMEYVIKTNHGSGQVIAVKGSVNQINITSRLSGWLTNNYYWADRENQYFNIKPRILIEEYLHSKDASAPLDYRFWCFNGTPEVIQVDNHAHDINPFFDTQWNQLDLSYRKGASRPIIERPVNLEKMISIASQLSADFDFVRVDLYNLEGKILFGELTFTPVSGRLKLQPESWDLKLGEKWELTSEIQ